MREGKKIIGSTTELFSSCFELPSPARVATPTCGSPPRSLRTPPYHKSLPSSPTDSRRASLGEPIMALDNKHELNTASLNK